jgi:putative oxidoreductase
LRRLFSTFAAGPAGVGLLLLRIASGAILILHAITTLQGISGAFDAVLQGASAAIGLLLIAGVWTPIVGVLAGIAALLNGLSDSTGSGNWLLPMTVSVALALLGPGAWSVDARLFGWKRIEIQNREQ